MTPDLARLKALALAAIDAADRPGTSLTDEFLAFSDEATPAAVLALLEHLERSESIALTLEEQVACLRSQRDEYQARAEHAEGVVNGTLPPFTVCPMCFHVHDPRIGDSHD